MIKIAVCDDENNICSKISGYLKAFAENEGIFTETVTFSKGSDMLAALRNGTEFDIIFLDIEFAAEKGSDIGNIIRTEFPDSLIEIVYISYHEKYAMSLFESTPLDFIIKPVTYDKTERVMRKYMKRTRGIYRDVYNIIEKGGTRKVLIKDILYFERGTRNTVVVMNDGKYISRGSFNDISAEPPLLKIHNSIIINTKYISAYRYSEITMRNGDIKPVSRSYQKSVRQYIIANCVF